MKNKHLLLLLLLIVVTPWVAKAQGLDEYTYSTGQDQAKWITLSNNATTIVTSGQQNTASSLTNIGFTFHFGNSNYTKFWANSNGILSFNSSPSGSSYLNQFNPTSYTANQPKICGISRAMSTGNNGYIKYEQIGTAPNRIMVCEFKLYASNGTNYAATTEWQVQLHESGSKVVMVYEATPTPVPSIFQIGLSQSRSDILTINPQTHTVTHSTEAATPAYSVWPGAYRYYEFECPCCPCPTQFSCLGTTGTLGTPTSATFTWTTHGSENQWLLEYSTQENFSNATQITINQSDLVDGIYTLTGLNANTQYYARIMANCPSCNDGEGAYSIPSNECSFIHILFPKPQDITFTNTAIDHITANWTAPNENVTGYNYRYSIDGGNTWTALTSTTATSVNITDLPYAGHLYIFAVQAIYADGASEFATANFATVLCLPEDKCQITFHLYDTEGNGWEGNYIQVVDAMTNVVVETVTLTGGSSRTYTVDVCDGREIRFQYVKKPNAVSYPQENSWVIKDAYGETIWQYSYPTGNISWNYTINCAGVTCKRPSNFSTVTTTAHGASFAWTDGEAGQTAWQVSYSFNANFSPNEGNIVNITHDNNSIDGLLQDTVYYAYIRANCGDEDGFSDWNFEKLTFRTLVGNQMPTNLSVATDPAVTTTTATIIWSGAASNMLHQNYELYYSTYGTLPIQLNPQTYITGITASSQNLVGLTPETNYYVWVRDNCGEDGYSQWRGPIQFTTEPLCYAPENLTVVTGSITAQNATLEWEGSSENYLLELGTINYSSTPTIVNILSEGFRNGIPTGWTHIGNGTTTAYNKMGYNDPYCIRFYTTSGVNMLVLPEFELEISDLSISYWSRAYIQNISGSFDVGYVTDPTQASTFIPVYTNSSETTVWRRVNASFANAPAGARIAFRHHSAVSAWLLDDVTISAPEYPVVWSTDGSIANQGNNGTYTLHGLSPETTYKVRVRGNCGSLGLSSHYSNEVKFTTAPCLATFTKNINGYGTSTSSFYLIASPLADDIDPADIYGMIDGEYDLYYFDQAKELEWRNYETNPFSIDKGKGYLYAHSTDNTLTFCGSPYEGDGTVALEYVEGTDFAGWNLIGNPFGSNATLDMPFFRLNTEGTALKTETETTAIEAMEGVFVQADETGQTATFTEQTRGNQYAPIARANILLSDNKGLVLDNAIVRFDQGATLGKFQLRANSSAIYFPMEGKDFAIVNADEAGELPLNFKAEDNGIYTLTLTQEGISFTYLHLIDNMTGADQDLLANPSYSFDAHTNDYASRFRLLFSTGSSIDGESFGFVNAAGNLCIFGIEDEATLQVIDINGRVLSSEQFNGNYEGKLNLAPGMYLLRLISDSDVKVQKMVVR